MFEGMTPWGPIVLVVAVSVCAALAARKVTRDAGYGFAAATLVLALASAALGTIATVGYVAAALFLLVSVAVYFGVRA